MATEIAKAYVQIIPQMKGVKADLENELGGSAASTGEKTGLNFVGALKNVIAGAAIGKVVKDALDAGGALQQSFGGLETIYGEAAEGMKDMAVQAAAAGISANDYAEQAVSFGAALKQAYGGDTVKAAEAANAAIMAVADNSAKMGTDIGSVTAAFQGFAKGNYTLLDNLKLGYGGTKTEMERLLADAEKLTGVHYDIDNLGDVYNAIGAIQENLGVAGVAAKEAQTTFSGSFGAMKAALQNFYAMLTTGGDVTGALDALVQSASTFLIGNLLPMVGNIIAAIPGLIAQGLQTIAVQAPIILEQLVGMVREILANLQTASMSILETMGGDSVMRLIDGIVTQIPMLLEQAVQIIGSFARMFMQNLPQIQQKGAEMLERLISGIMEALPGLITTVGDLVVSFADTLASNAPTIMTQGVQMILTIVQGITSSLPQILTAAVTVITTLIGTLAEHLPEILETGITILLMLIEGLLKAIPDVVAAIPQIIQSIVNTFSEFNWAEIGHNIMEGIKNGILSKIDSVIEAAKSGAQRVLDAAKGFLQIGSPSKVFAREVGRWIPEGIAMGIRENMDSVTDEMRRAADLTEMAYSANVTAPDMEVNADKDETLLMILQMLVQYFPEFEKNKGANASEIYNVINRQMGMAIL